MADSEKPTFFSDTSFLLAAVKAGVFTLLGFRLAVFWDFLRGRK